MNREENRTPVADAASLAATNQRPNRLELRGSGPGPLVFGLASAPLHGRVYDLDERRGLVTYEAEPGYVGEDSFTFTVGCRGELSEPARVTLGVVDNPAVI